MESERIEINSVLGRLEVPVNRKLGKYYYVEMNDLSLKGRSRN